VVRVLDDDAAEDGSVFIVMELLEGDEVDALAEKNGGKLPPELVMDLAHQLAGVLAAANDKGIVHRDIKPQNLFLTTEGTLKVLDFGLARVAMMATPHATQSGEVFGTPAFMPPEQALGRTSEVDHRSDLWAIGATMFTLLSGRCVHEASSINEQLIYAASRPAPSLASLAPHVPKPIVAVVDRALSFKKGDRFPDGRAMQRAIEEACVAAFGTLPPHASVQDPRRQTPAVVARSGDISLGEAPTIPRAMRAPRRRTLWIGASLAFVVAAIGITAFVLGGADTPDEAALAAASSEPLVVTNYALPTASGQTVAKSPSVEPSASATPTTKPRVSTQRPTAPRHPKGSMFDYQ